ncbi:ABC transporter ATP-binding protein [Paenibacillus radicis (ex Xue et al. 2023)]|uniref:ABC transporter ATP-binding protein/permease n=1 Tax=Paenibacillus radicis (ex Xue et al. 2023) TaxID=2972489 RepID=A0ABT1YDM3_9BACL|nr:ABC transporter ATP-binding protein [Paenibacillus radicis (ex Xue et al. 2023)]MCR8631308.1 ABC transporter ATP-binding protein/permease [Paenibacillus radicis (ex Xue et al. 2023)]
MLFMNKYVSKYWKLFCLAFLCLTAEALCDLLQPAIMAKIIDIGVANQKMDYVWQMGGLMLFITAMGALAASARNVVATQVSQRFGAELRSDLFRKIQTLSFQNIDQFDRASLVTRLTNDVTQVQNFVNGLMRIFVKAPLLCIGALIMAARLDSHLAMILVIVVPIVGVLIALNMKVGFPFFMKVQKALDRVNSVMREYLSGVRVVRAFNRFDYEVNKFNDANQEYQTRSRTAMRAMAIFSPGITLTVNLGIIAVLWLGGLRVDNGQMQVGTTIAFVNYMTQILFALMTISMVFNMFVRAKASTGRIGEVFAQENSMVWNEVPVHPLPIKGRVDFEQVSFLYEGTMEPVIKNVTFSCLPGETVGIIGSTGSGKSSLVSLIPRFYDPNSGAVKVNGIDVREMDPTKLRDKIAVVPQKTVLFTGTVLENIRIGKEDATLEEVEQAARMADAHGFVSSFPEGYNTVLGQQGVNFSGGQKQRVSIARALVRKPEILILDDCTSAVDVTTEANIKEALKKYAKGLTCLIIAQRITSVMDADKIIVLDHGQIVGIGKHDELIRDCDVYQEIFQSQVGKEMQKNG